jgi:phosphohistidine phosphatase
VGGVGDHHHNLLLLRHAKSAYPNGVADRDRPLAPRGVREAGLVGDWLRANFPAVDAVLCSTATRARETLARAAVDAPVRYVERLYGATPAEVIDEINRVDDDADTVLVVGHEPTISEVAIDLAGAEGTNTAAVERISAKFPTSAIAVLQVPCRWERLEIGDAALISFHVPR